MGAAHRSLPFQTTVLTWCSTEEGGDSGVARPGSRVRNMQHGPRQSPEEYTNRGSPRLSHRIGAMHGGGGDVVGLVSSNKRWGVSSGGGSIGI
jgi:hypothetical protein